MGSSVAHSNWKELKNFSKKLDNFKNLCYNKYVRLREAQSDENPRPSQYLLLCGRGWNWYTRRTQNPLPQGVRVRISPPARGKVEPGTSVAAQFPKISKEVNSKEIVDRRAATRRNQISLLPLFYLDVQQIKINLTYPKICAIITS